MDLASFSPRGKTPRHPARIAVPPPVPDATATLRRLVAAPVPLSELPAIARAAGIKRSVAQGALGAGLRTGTVTLRRISGVACVVATEGEP